MDIKIDNYITKPIIHYAKEQKIILRKKQLFEKLSEKKLAYRKNSICDAYIKYGKYSINEVINNINDSTLKEEKRLNILLRKLKNRNEIYDESISYYKNYIKNGGNIEDTITDGIKEWFYINKTDYLELMDKYRDEYKAKTLAFNNYVKKNGIDKYINLIRNTEMKIHVY